jgi:hypothetical protein
MIAKRVIDHPSVSIDQANPWPYRSEQYETVLNAAGRAECGTIMMMW